MTRDRRNSAPTINVLRRGNTSWGADTSNGDGPVKSERGLYRAFPPPEAVAEAASASDNTGGVTWISKSIGGGHGIGRTKAQATTSGEGSGAARTIAQPAEGGARLEASWDALHTAGSAGGEEIGVVTERASAGGTTREGGRTVARRGWDGVDGLENVVARRCLGGHHHRQNDEEGERRCEESCHIFASSFSPFKLNKIYQ